ncbi:MAG: NAD-dependent epimerase/dehydratase family protein [Burkholderiales bacterium]|jgi:CDP-glucose 4,6-dehydratase|nr:NAD-dependent epimerase/dehydratase family protein [Burkholderiales bacterium]
MEVAVSAFDWANRNVLVTGVSGFLGSWLAQALVDRGARVVGLVRDEPSQENRNYHRVASRIVRVRGELEDGNLMVRLVNEHEVEAVFHLGAQTIVGTANRHPLSTFTANIQGTWNLLEACRQAPLVRRVVVASSDKAYGDLERAEPVSEDAPLRGLHPYDVSKSCADLLAVAYHKTYGLPVAITRCGNFYGGGDLNFNRLVPGTVRAVLRGQAPVLRSDGTFRREYVYVKDAVGCYLLLAEKLEQPGVAGEAFNFSAQAPLGALEMVHEILRAAGRPDLTPRVLDLPEARLEIPYQALDSGKAHRVLGWTPRWSLREGLQETIEWYREDLGARENPGGP